MTEQIHDDQRETDNVDTVENEDIERARHAGQDRSAPYSIDQAQAEREAHEGRETFYDASDPV